MATRLTVILSEGRADLPSGRRLERELLTALADWADVEVRWLPHLYDLAAEGPGMKYLRSVAGDMIVLSALYPRAAFWLLDSHAVQGRMGRTSFFPEEELEPAAARLDGVPRRTIWCIDVRDHREPAPLLAEMERLFVESTGEAVAHVAHAEESKVNGQLRIEEATSLRWYPVVDRSRCVNCFECLNFCLFGTFGLDEAERILVEQPDACRNGCPACARVCPSRAIMFPQHRSPTIAGGPESSTDAQGLDFLPPLAQIQAAELAEDERRRALAAGKETESAGNEQAEKGDDLDHLVDDVDKMDL